MENWPRRRDYGGGDLRCAGGRRGAGAVKEKALTQRSQSSEHRGHRERERRKNLTRRRRVRREVERSVSAEGHRRFCRGLRGRGRRWRKECWRGVDGRFRRREGRRRGILWRRWGRLVWKTGKPRSRLKFSSCSTRARYIVPLLVPMFVCRAERTVA